MHWTAHPEPLYKAGGNPSGLDKQYAHKISLVYNPKNETFYLYYCACGNKGRGIGLITSKPLPSGSSLPTNTALTSAADDRYTDRSLSALGITSVRRSVVSDVPAATWEKAMVTGNGIQGAMAMGRAPEETIVLNHAGLFLPLAAPFPTVNQARILPELRQMIAEGKFQAAADRVFAYGQEEGKNGNTWTDPFVPACSLRVVMPQRGAPQGYLRSTDF